MRKLLLLALGTFLWNRIKRRAPGRIGRIVRRF